MTIKSRTRLNLTFFILSCITFVLFLGLFIYQKITGSVYYPAPYFLKSPHKQLIIGYSPSLILVSIFIELFYVMFTTIMLWRSFIKTQSSIIAFYLFFLFAIYTDTFRIFIPIFHISSSFSKTVLIIGNISLFSRVLAPLAILHIGIMTFEDQPQNVNKYSIMLLFISIFMAVIIPLNSTKILPTFCISHGFSKTLQFATFFINILSIFTVFISNVKTESNQLTTLGFFLICVGYTFLFYCYSVLNVLLGFSFLFAGTTIYLTFLHKEYLWK